MTNFRTNTAALLLATLALCSNTQCSSSSSSNDDAPTAPAPVSSNVAPLPALNSTRTSRLMKVLADPKVLVMKRYRGAPSKLMPRADHFPPAGVAPAVMLHGRKPVPYRRLPPPHPAAPYLMKSHPGMVRRVQNVLAAGPALPPHARFAGPFDGGKNVRHTSTSKGPVPFNAGKVSQFRPPYGAAQPQPQSQSHPNALAQSTTLPSAAGVVKHQKQQQQQQQQLQQQHQLQQTYQQHQQQQQQQQIQLYLQQQQHQSPQQQQQQQQHAYYGTQDYNFKASPPFNGQAIVRPLFEAHNPPKQYTPHTTQYPAQQHQQHQQQQQRPVQQYPIPQQPTHKQQVSQSQLLHQSSSQSQSQSQSQLQFSHTQSPTKSPVFHYETMRPHEEPVLHPHVKHEHGPPGLNGYAVYEDNELTDELSTSQRAQTYQHFPASDEQLLQHHHFSPETSASRDAEDYLKFMSTDEYFLPKREPNYRQRDVEQTPQSQYQSKYQDQQQQQQTHYSKSASDNTGDGSAASYLNEPIEVSQLFYQEDSSPTIVRGSYQTGNNLFVVNSDGKKAVKHVVPAPTTAAPTYAHYGSAGGSSARHRTPEPVRFEFTERDAVPGSYTNSPLAKEQEHLRYKAAGVVVTTSTPHLPTVSSSGTTVGIGTGTSGGNYNVVAADDPEDDDDVHTASSDRDVYGRVPIRQTATGAFSPSPAPVEQKDTEDYCERICANIQDDDEEIVCGSDGYMYTSEAQMECYASCLHIDVTIQSKGSCSAT